MHTTKDQSFGIIPVININKEWKVLLVHQISYYGDSFWTLPKGHLEANETEVEAAKRELFEETGVKKIKIMSSPTFLMTYDFIHQGVKIDKKVKYFLGLLDSTTISIQQPEEIKALRITTFKEAKKAVAHKETKRILSEAESAIAGDQSLFQGRH